jgi:hypothetical protein
MRQGEVMRIYRTFNAASEPFRRESERHETGATPTASRAESEAS